MSEHVTVLGGGNFGTVLANIMALNGHRVTLWLRDAALAEEINSRHQNSKYFKDYQLHPDLRATTDLEQALEGVTILVFCVPSGVCRELAATVAKHISTDVAVLSTAKGIESETFKVVSVVLSEELPKGVSIGVLSGPNIATELARGETTATVLACSDEALMERVHKLLYCSYLRVYNSADMYGVELAGALKNIYAIIGGVATSKKMGYNSIALLITRSLAEMCRFAVATGAKAETFLGLAGTGDLVVTFLSPHSRNHRFGLALGEGKSTEEALAAVGQTVEGVSTLRAAHAQARDRGLYMPLMEGLYRMVYENVSMEVLLDSLMHSEQRADVDVSITKSE